MGREGELRNTFVRNKGREDDKRNTDHTTLTQMIQCWKTRKNKCLAREGLGSPRRGESCLYGHAGRSNWVRVCITVWRSRAYKRCRVKTGTGRSARSSTSKLFLFLLVKWCKELKPKESIETMAGQRVFRAEERQTTREIRADDQIGASSMV